MTLDQLTRWQAGAIHFTISVAIAASLVAAMLLAWYPRPYFAAAGGAMLLVLLIGVDVVIGPLLTLVVFDPRKKRLKQDLAVIALLQLAALGYGTSVMFSARPVFMAFAGDRFELVSANEIDDADLALAPPGFRTLSLTGPRVVGAALPNDPRERARLGQAAILGASIGLFPQHYVPYGAVARNAAARGFPLTALRDKSPGHAAEIDAIAAASGGAAALRYLPLQSRRSDMAVVVDAVRGDIRGVLAVDPEVGARCARRCADRAGRAPRL